MKIERPVNSINSISFKAISLNKDETKRTDDLLRAINDPAQKQQSKLELFDIFDKHLQNEAKTKSKGLYYHEDFLQRLYMLFFESLENIKALTTDKLLEILNKTKPNHEEIKEHYRLGTTSLDKELANTHGLTLGETIPDTNIPHTLSETSLEERNEQLKKIHTLAENLSEKEQHSLKQRAVGKTYRKIAAEENVSEVNIRLRTKSAIVKLQLNNNVLPQKHDLFADNFIKTFDLKISKEAVIKFLVNNIELTDYNISKLNANINKLSKSLKVDRQALITAALKQSSLFRQKPETLTGNIERTSKLLDIDKKTFTRAALRYPPLFQLKPETFSENMEKTSKLLEIERKTFTAATLKSPSLFCLKPETIFANIEKTSKLLEVDRQTFIQSALRNPALFLCKPETIFGNIEKISKLLKFDRQLITNAALNSPALFIQRPETILSNVEKASKLLGVDREVFMKEAFKRPTLLSHKPESIAKKANIIKYYKQIQGKNNSALVFSTNSDKNLYYNILSCLIKNTDGLNAVLKQDKMLKYLNTQNKVYNFTIPLNELAEEFIEYAQRFSMNNFGKQIFKIVIT